MKFLITGCDSGLGKFLIQNIPNSIGLNRDNYNLIKDDVYDIIVHCAFNKENEITDYKKYLDDNIFLTKKIKDIKHQKFIYISSVDVYQENQTTYSLFKKFSESMMNQIDLVLRCPTLIGPTMKKNHIEKIKNSEEITLSKDSIFNYILMDDLLEFITKYDVKNFSGVIDFVPNDSIKIIEVSNYFQTEPKFGDYHYTSDYNFDKPIYKILNHFDKSSKTNLEKYYG